MKILTCSHRFSPDIGGIETVSLLLAQEFARAGHDVRVVTQTAEGDGRGWPFGVVRAPSRRELLRQARWCDVFFQNNISLQTLWPALLLRKPLVVAHHTWLIPTGGRETWRTRLKRILLRRGRNIAISRAIAEHAGVQSVIIGNPYDDSVFRLLPEVARDRELVLLGRLVSDKGADLLLDALGLLSSRGSRPRLTIVGTGSEESALRAQAERVGLAAQVEFVGALSGDALARCLNRHRIIVVPSRWAEPYGLVALEGIACGCAAVGSDRGGLPEAIGPCGVTFPSGDAAALATALERLLCDDAMLARLTASAPEHLAGHTVPKVAAAYLRVLAEAANGSAGPS